MKNAIITIIELLVIISVVYQYFNLNYNYLINDIEPNNGQLFIFINTTVTSFFAVSDIVKKLDKIAEQEEG